MLSREAGRGAGRGVRGAPTHAARGTRQAELGCRSLTTQSAAQGPREGVEVRHHGDVTLGETPGQRLDLGNRLPQGTQEMSGKPVVVMTGGAPGIMWAGPGMLLSPSAQDGPPQKAIST